MSAEGAYLAEIETCDIYLVLLGAEYGYEDSEGISATEREYDRATELKKYRLAFVKKGEGENAKQKAFVRKVEESVVRKAFMDFEGLRSAVYAALIYYLEEKEFLRVLPFDAASDKRAKLADIDDDKVAVFLNAARTVRAFPLPVGTNKREVLTHLNLIDDEGHITNAALLLFGKQPQKFFISSEVKCAHFYGNDVCKPIPSYQVYQGDVFQLIDQAVAFVASRIDARVGARDKGAQVDVDYEIPLPAITEAIVNAVAHRDYTSNASVQVMLFRNRLEIWNPGTLPAGMTIEKLKIPHASSPVNPLLANPLYLSGYIERAGTGTRDILDRCKAHGLKTPEFVQDEDFRTILWRTDQATIADNQSYSITTDQATDQATDQVTDQAKGVDPRVLKIVELLYIPRKRAELQALADIKHNETFRKNYLGAAITEGYVAQSHPDNPTHPGQLYFLTEKGKALLEVANEKKLI